MSGETESKTSTSSSTAAKEAERKERIIKLKRKIEYDAEIIEQIKDDISKIDDNGLKKSLNSTKIALTKEKKKDEETLKNMSLTLLQQRHAEVQKARKEAGVSSDAFLSTFTQHLYPKKKAKEVKGAKKVAATRDTNRPWRRTRKWFGGKRKTKRKIRTRRKKRTKRRRTRQRSKKRRTRRRRKTKRRRGGTLGTFAVPNQFSGGARSIYQTSTAIMKGGMNNVIVPPPTTTIMM